MKQLKTMGYSALLLLLLCLNPIDGFLETHRKTMEQRNTDIRKIDNNDRNFFGNTWHRSYGTSQERRDVRQNNGNFNDENSRQLDNDRMREIRDSSRRFSDSRDDRISRQLDTKRNHRQMLALKNDRESRLTNSFDKRDSRRFSSSRQNERQTSEIVPNNVNDRIRKIEIQPSENDRRVSVHQDSRQLHRLGLTERRDMRSVSLDRVRHQISLSRKDRRVNSQENDRESPQMNRRVSTERREVRLLSSSQIREDRYRKLSQNREQTRRSQSDRILEARQISEVRKYNSELRQQQRQEIRSTLADRSKTFDNSRFQRENEKTSGRLENRKFRDRQISEVRNNQGRLDTRSTSLNRVQDVSHKRILIVREADGKSHQLQRREIPFISSDRSRIVDINQRQRQFDDRRQESQSIRSRQVGDRQFSDIREIRKSSNRQEIPSLSSRNVNNIRRQIFVTRKEDKISRQFSADRRQESTLSSGPRTTNNSRRYVSVTREDERMLREGDKDRTRNIRSVLSDRSRETKDRRVSETRDVNRESRQQFAERRDSVNSRQLNTDRQVERRSLVRQDRITLVQQPRRDLRDIRILERRLTRESDSRASDATRRILTLSSKDENNNRLKYARAVDERQSSLNERRMATSFNTVSYIPQMKTNALINAAQVILLSFLVAQVVSNTSKAKKNWFLDLTNFVTVTKEKVL